MGVIADRQKQAKLFIDANVWDGEDRSGCSGDSAVFTPDELQFLIDDLIEHLHRVAPITVLGESK